MTGMLPKKATINRAGRSVFSFLNFTNAFVASPF